MADRFVLKQFAGNATNNGAFGAAQDTGAGVQPVANIKDVQSLNAFEQGWNSATLTADKLPALEEMQGLEALLCKAIKENYSEGIPLWISGETYYQDSRAVYNGKVYRNKTGSYTANNPATDTANWELDKPDTAGTADKLGSSNVGSSTQPMYLSSGTATASTATVGTATKPVYLSAGTITQGDELAKIDFSNINASGEQVVKDLITSTAANVDLSNLSATGNTKFQAPITGAATTITSSNLTASRALISNANGKVAVSSITSTELGYLSGVTSAIQTQLNGKQATITGAASTIASSNLTASRALVSDSSGKVAVSSITSTKLGYLTDVTSNIQAQINGKVSSASPALTGTPTAPTAASTVNNTQIATTAYVVAHRCTTAATTTSSASIYKPAIVVENYNDGTNWYRVWSDGWIEQGYRSLENQGTSKTFTYLKPFQTAPTLVVNIWSSTSNSNGVSFQHQGYNRTNTGFQVSAGSSYRWDWYACGY